MKRGVDAADQVGGSLEAERGAVERALLPLVHADQVYGAELAQVVAGGETQDRGRGHREESLFLEASGDLPASRAKECFRIEKRHLPQLIGDGVVHPPLQPPATQRQLLTAVPDLKRPQTQSRAVAGAGGVVPKPHLESRRRTLSQEEV